MAERKVDTPGETSGPILTPNEDSEPRGPLLIEIPLWKYGRIKLESSNSKSSLAAFVFLVLCALAIVLVALEAMFGSQPGLAALVSRVGEGLFLVIGVLIGAHGSKQE